MDNLIGKRRDTDIRIDMFVPSSSLLLPLWLFDPAPSSFSPLQWHGR